jgi:hypothetical protein
MVFGFSVADGSATRAGPVGVGRSGMGATAADMGLAV